MAERPVPGADTDEQEPPTAEKAGKKPEQTKYRFSTLPEDASLERLVLLAHARWVIEQFYEDATQECGFDHFQGRSWNGLHRHLALVLLAYSFLMLHRLTLPPPPNEAFSPLRHAKLATWRASPGAALAVPGSHLVADSHAADRVLPPQQKLTK